MSVLFAAGTVCMALLVLARRRIARVLLVLVIGACVFLQGGHLLKDYNPVAEDRFFFPVTKAIASLQDQVGKDRLAILGEDMIPPDSNIAYHIDVAQNYDGMWVRDLDALYRREFGESNNWRPMLKCSRRALQLFGVRFVLAKWGWNSCDDGLREFGKAGGQQPIRHEILPGREVTQTFQARENLLDTVMVVLSTFPKTRACTLGFELVDLDSGEVVSRQTMTSADLQASVYSKKHVVWPNEYELNPRGRPVVFRFEPQKSSFLRHYKLTLSCPDGRGDDTIVAWSMPLNGYGDGQAFQGKRPLAGELLFDWSSAGDDFEPVAHIEDYVLYRFRSAMPKYALVGGSVIAENDAEALDLVRAPGFDPRKLVVLCAADLTAAAATADSGPRDNSKKRVLQFSDSKYCYMLCDDGKTLVHVDDEITFVANKLRWDAIEHVPAADRAKYAFVDDADRAAKKRAGLRLVNPPAPFAAPIEVLEETPTRIRLRVQRVDPAYLVIQQAFFPGWKAWMNGERAPLCRANCAFDALEIPPGDWTVELRYAPDSLRLGLWIGALSLVLGIGSLALSLRAARTSVLAPRA